MGEGGPFSTGNNNLSSVQNSAKLCKYCAAISESAKCCTAQLPPCLSPGRKKPLQVAQPTTLPGPTVERLRRHRQLRGPRGGSKGCRTTSEGPCTNRSNHGEHTAATVLHDDGEAKQGDLVIRAAVRTEPQNDNNDHHNCARISSTQRDPGASWTEDYSTVCEVSLLFVHFLSVVKITFPQFWAGRSQAAREVEHPGEAGEQRQRLEEEVLQQTQPAEDPEEGRAQGKG